MTPQGDITALLAELSRGHREAETKLVPLVYDELRRLAARYLRRERPDHTLQPTALVHEAYLRLAGQRRVSWHNRAHFFAVASQIMRRILVDHARSRGAARRGDGVQRVELREALLSSTMPPDELLALDEALQRLASRDPRQSRIVELRFFGGLTTEESAQVLAVSQRTVEREWTLARAWLHGEIRKGVRS